MKTFANIPDNYARYDTAEIVLLPVMYDGTSTWGKGADKSLPAFLDAAANMELYDIISDTQVFKRGIFLAETLSGFDSPEEMAAKVNAQVTQFLQDGKFVTLLGGEHSISIPSIRAFGAACPQLTVIQIDAHADLRPEYEGTPLNHACAVYEASRHHNLIQIGIRSMDHSEKAFMNRDQTYFMHDIYNQQDWISKLVDQVKGEVYITLDLDAFDSSLMPSTGTPEPGGMQYFPVIELVRKLSKKTKIRGFDVVELAPNPHNKAPDFLTAKLYYQMLSLIMKHK